MVNISQHHGNPFSIQPDSDIAITTDSVSQYVIVSIIHTTDINMIITTIIIILPLCVSKGDRLDVMVFVVLDKDSKDCVATKGCVDQEVALVHSHI